MRSLLLFLAVFACAGPAFAQLPDSTSVDSLVYLLEPISVAVERERSAPPPVGALTLSPVQLQRAQGANIYQMMRRVSGIEVHDQGQGPGYASNVVMRGFTSDHSSDVLLVIDGVPVNLPAHGHVEGYADWSVLAPASVSSLRVIHGNASPLYGDFALAGAVEVFTRAEAEGTDASFSGSSFGDAAASLSTGTAGERSGTFVSAEGRRGEGWRAGSDNWVANGLLRGWRAGGGGRVEGGAGIYASGWDSPGFVSVPDYNARAFQNPVDQTDGGYSRRAVVHGRFARPVGRSGHLQATAWGMASEYALYLNVPGHDHGGVASGILQQSGEWDERVGTGGQIESGWTLPTGDLLFGVSGRVDRVTYDHALTLSRDVVDPEISLSAGHWAGAVYARWRMQAGSRLGLDLGGRVDAVGHRSTSLLEVDAPAESARNVIVSPKMGGRFLLSGPWYAVGSSARGFRSAVGIIGDPARKPYISWSHEVGIEREGDDWSLEVAAFRVTVDNERVFDPITLSSTGAGSSVRQGVDFRATLGLPLGVAFEADGTWNHARLSAAYVDAHDDHSHDVFDTPDPVAVDPSEESFATHVPGLARYVGRMAVAAPLAPAVEARVSFQLAGPHVPIGEPTVQTQPYSLLDVGASWEVSPGRVIDLEVENVMGIRYVELRSGGFVTPGAPRSLRLQVRVDRLTF